MIAIRGLTKRYRHLVAVDDLTLDVPSGSVCGLLGRNGAGKTTAFKCLLGFARPNAGDVRFDGKPLVSATFERLGFVPERPTLYPWLTVAQHLEIVRRSYRNYDDAYARELLAAFALDPHRKAKKLSKGQQTALALVMALVFRPAILLLDEPASGLDPVLQRVVLDLLIDAAANGATILLSSHQIGQVERAADRVAVLRDGRLVLSGEIDALRESSKIVEATFLRSLPRLDALQGDASVRRWECAGTTIRAYANGTADELTARFCAMGAGSVRVLDRSLEDLFLDAVTDGGELR
jgi:ABC-2 type transport system ATP-binding protein